MESFWQQLTQTQPLPPARVVFLAAVAAVVMAVRSSLQPGLRRVVTIAHEGSHALVALLAGRSVQGVRLHRDTSGLTSSRGPSGGFGLIATLAAGYPGPALLGLGGAWLLGRGRAVLLLWLLLVAVVLLVLLIRNWFGLGMLALTAAVLVAVTGWAPGQLQTAFAYAVVWFLLLATPISVLDMMRTHRRGRGAGSDAAQLGALTILPAPVWSGLFLLVTLGALALGSVMMLGRFW